MHVYYYCWGDEDVPGSRIDIIKEEDNLYTLTFEQEGFDPECFSEISTRYKEIVRKVKDLKIGHGIIRRTIFLRIETYLNPRPEKIFDIS